MKYVERVLCFILQAADIIGAEFGEVDRVRLFTVHATEVDLVMMGSGLVLGGRAQARAGGWSLGLGLALGHGVKMGVQSGFGL